MRRQHIGILILLTCLMIGVFGCGGHSGPPANPEPNVVLRFYWPTDRGPSREIPVATETIEVTVTADGMETVTATVDKSQVVDGVAEVELFVLPGPARTFTAQAKDSAGTVIGEGAATVDLQRGQTTQVSIVMTAFTPQLAVSPTSLDFGDTDEQLTFTVSNVGNLALNWSVAPATAERSASSGEGARLVSNVSWITSITPESGQLPPAESTTVTVEVSRAVTPGAHSADLLVTSDGGEATVSVSVTVPAPWPMFRQNPQHTGRSPYVGPQTASVKWPFYLGDYCSPSPAIGSDGTIYVGSTDYNLYAINADGTEKWRFPATWYIDGSDPAVGADGTIYVGSNDSYLYAVNPDGTEKWSFPTGNGIYSSPTVGPDGTVYVGSWDGNLYAVNPDGSQQWAFPAGDRVECSAAIAPDGTIYVGAYVRGVQGLPLGRQIPPHGVLQAVNPDGTQKWPFQTGDAVESSPAVGADGTIYVGCNDLNLYAVNPDGTQKWAFPTDAVVGSSPAIGADGTIYVVSDALDSLYAISPDGTQKWTYPSVSGESSPAIGADGTIYVGSNDGYVYAINPDGTQKWAFPAGYRVDSSPAMGADGVLYVASNDGYLLAIENLGAIRG